MTWWKRNGWKILLPLIAVVLLTVTFFWDDFQKTKETPMETPVVSTTPQPESTTPPTDTPVPSAQPTAPVQTPAPTPEPVSTCTISISCATALSSADADSGKISQQPADGWILPALTVTITEGESVFDVLLRVCRENGILMEFSNTPIYHSAYIEGINNLYEFDCGSLSGWMYQVNGWFPNYGCSRYTVQDGDVICWVYTCDLGQDVGADSLNGTWQSEE